MRHEAKGTRPRFHAYRSITATGKPFCITLNENASAPPYASTSPASPGQELPYGRTVANYLTSETAKQGHARCIDHGRLMMLGVVW